MSSSLRSGSRALAQATEAAVLGNASGWRNTVEGRRTLRRMRRTGGSRLPRRSTDRVAWSRAAQLRRSGITRFDLHIPPASLERAATRFDELITDEALCADRGPDDEPWVHRYLVDPTRPVPEIGALLTPAVGEVIEAFYGSHFRVRTVRAYRNRAPERVPTEDVYANNWHLDPELTCDLRYFVYLTDTTTDEAALETIDRPATRQLLRSGFVDRWHVYGPARRMLAERPVTHEGPRGTAILVDAQHVMHRAGTCAPGRHRDVAQFWITPASAPMARDWAARLPDDPSFRGGEAGDG